MANMVLVPTSHRIVKMRSVTGLGGDSPDGFFVGSKIVAPTQRIQMKSRFNTTAQDSRDFDSRTVFGALTFSLDKAVRRLTPESSKKWWGTQSCHAKPQVSIAMTFARGAID